ncbi:hypothetical protein FGO68_gene6483 [Halteria grandinella]|uniref:Macro domain-containing protein n=1 Tax=Halteria grandinella TaxID=5974 RepID=A0A8J8T499_HALGN|nr:hypothetical protein FGO68_gene6483 [Halteria grandinella]
MNKQGSQRPSSSFQVNAQLPAQIPQKVEGYLLSYGDYQHTGSLLEDLTKIIQLQYKELTTGKNFYELLDQNRKLFDLARQLEQQQRMDSTFCGIKLDSESFAMLKDEELKRCLPSSQSNGKLNKNGFNFDQSGASDSYRQQEDQQNSKKQPKILASNQVKWVHAGQRMNDASESEIQRSNNPKVDEGSKILEEELLKQKQRKENEKQADSKNPPKPSVTSKLQAIPSLNPTTKVHSSKAPIVPYKQEVEVGPTYNLKYDGWLQIQLMKGNLLEQRVEAIVNAANSYLSHAGGIAGQIAKYGGNKIMQESQQAIRQLGGRVETGDCAVTSAGNLYSSYGIKHVIHAVGPIWDYRTKDKDGLLQRAIYQSLLKANQHYCKSVALPALSSGIFGYPKDLCAQVLFKAIDKYAEDAHYDQSKKDSLNEIRIVIYDDETYIPFQHEFKMRYARNDDRYKTYQKMISSGHESSSLEPKFRKEQIERISGPNRPASQGAIKNSSTNNQTNQYQQTPNITNQKYLQSSVYQDTRVLMSGQQLSSQIYDKLGQSSMANKYGEASSISTNPYGGSYNRTSQQVKPPHSTYSYDNERQRRF